MDRRTLLKTAGWLALGYPIGKAFALQERPQFAADPFSAGVASGDPTANGVVLWTRLIPDVNSPRDWQRGAVAVEWQIASDEALKKVVRQGRFTATPENGHSVHVDVKGLDPNRWYWYRFRTGNAESVTGRTKTAPSAVTDRIRFAFASCQRYQDGYYSAYQNLVREDLDFVVFLGDYIYEGVTGNGPRRLTVQEPKTLDGYRAHYALYRSDANLREAHRLFPWIIMWDDHEVQDNYAADIPKDEQPRADFLQRRAAAYQAHHEWLPLPKPTMPVGANAHLYRRLGFGPLANLFLLDERQYRSDQPCGDGNKAPCSDFLAERTMLGPQQERWIEKELSSSRAQWNIIGNPVRLTVFDETPGPAESYSMDQWSGYDTARRRIVSSLQTTKVRNPVAITGDIHSNWVGDLKADYRDAASAVVGAEIVGTSISSGGDGADRPSANVAARLAENPQIKFYNNQRGYVRCEVTRKSMAFDFRVVPRVTVPNETATTRATYIVEDGVPGAQKVSG